jgi:hypothetical protein
VVAGPLAGLLDVLAGQVERDERGVNPETSALLAAVPVVRWRPPRNRGLSRYTSGDILPPASSIAVDSAAGWTECGPGEARTRTPGEPSRRRR